MRPEGTSKSRVYHPDAFGIAQVLKKCSGLVKKQDSLLLGFLGVEIK